MASSWQVDLTTFYKKDDLDNKYDAVLTYGEAALDFVPVAEEKSATYAVVVHNLEVAIAWQFPDSICLHSLCKILVPPLP